MHTTRRRISAALLLTMTSAASVGAFALISVDQEIAIGREAQAEARKKTPQLRDSAITRYVEETYGKLRTRPQRRRNIHSGSYAAGETKGRTIQINRPLTGGQS